MKDRNEKNQKYSKVFKVHQNNKKTAKIKL